MSTMPLPSRDDLFPLKLSEGEGGQNPPPSRPGVSGPLSGAHFDQLRRMRRLARPVEKAIRYANFSGWTTLLAGALSLPFALHKPAMLVFCIVIAGIGTRELTLKRRLAHLDSTAPRKLAINQLCLGGALIVYAVFMLASSPGKGMVQTAMETDPVIQSTPELGGMMDDLVQLERLATALLYVGMIALAVIVQGGTALYYTLKGKRLVALHKQTPAWAVEVYRSVHA